MSITTLPPSWQTDEPPPVPIWRFTVEKYQQLGEIGVLGENDRVELLEGWIVPKMVHNPPHDVSVQLTGRVLRAVIPEGWCDRSQATVRTDDSAPEPDVAIVRGSHRDFISRHPEPGEVGLVVEVAESSLSTDRGTKARLYARAQIPCYWIINLIDRQLEVLTNPGGPADAPAYDQRQVFGPDDDVPFVLDGTELARIAVRELLP